jgi:hypothetical protein
VRLLGIVGEVVSFFREWLCTEPLMLDCKNNFHLSHVTLSQEHSLFFPPSFPLSL